MAKSCSGPSLLTTTHWRVDIPAEFNQFTVKSSHHSCLISYEKLEKVVRCNNWYEVIDINTLSACSIFAPPENVWKSLVFDVFKGYWNRTLVFNELRHFYSQCNWWHQIILSSDTVDFFLIIFPAFLFTKQKAECISSTYQLINCYKFIQIT